MASWMGVFEILAACVVLVVAVWVVRRRDEWTRGQKAGAVGSVTLAVAFLAFSGATDCAGTHLERLPGDPGYCKGSTGTAWLAFSVLAALAGLVVLACGAAFAWIDRTATSAPHVRR